MFVTLEKQCSIPHSRQLSGFGRPFSVCVGPDGFIYISDMDHHGIFRCDPSFETGQWFDSIAEQWLPLFSLSKQPSSNFVFPSSSRFHGPHSVTFLESKAYITTYYEPRIFCYSLPDWNLLKVVGAPDSDIVLTGPATTIADPANNQLLVTEYQQDKIIITPPNLAHASILKTPVLSRPHMAIAYAGNYYIADSWHHAVYQIAKNDHSLKAMYSNDTSIIREDSPVEQIPFSPNVPTAITANNYGGIIITEWGRNRFARLNFEKKLIETFSHPRFKKPYDAQFIHDNILAICNSHQGEVILLEYMSVDWIEHADTSLSNNLITHSLHA